MSKRDEMKDEMKIGDKDVDISLKCAKCGEAVQPGEEHDCKKEKDDAN